ncbi:hypothetical protein LTR36_010474 [Oleoguttula mirabilis]|uniref:Peroxin/Ferlin domain-containing protein n=1 Tax=Oleoguttula mirabilis TaxID=1507867 RepID=A0AAV9J4L8_9PEZI|nr:hypothetical protein LTR36_010474 [Oleoguttula mirabilis]
MSRQASFLGSLREVPTGDKLKAEHSISLVDHTKPAEEPNNNEQDAERADSDVIANPPTPANERLIKRLTNNSLTLQQSVRRQISKQKYSRYGQDRYGDEDDGTTNSSSALPTDEDPANAAQPGDPATEPQTGYLERGRAKANKLRKRKRTGLGGGKETADTVIDILYENQRGWFLFGVPRYSASSLLPSDPRPWQNKDFRTSPVDIRNSQVPDPSWEWVWKSWYVDMSRDVDEEGWEYSMLFKAGLSWHGNHPWFHSFVRRRRWLRMRRRKEVHVVTKEKGHELTAEYFTIHPHAFKPGSDEESDSKTTEMARRRARIENEVAIGNMDITDVGSLVRALRKAAVDREKLVAVRKFVADGGDELYYLSQHMSDIMSLFMYQSSRRQLLADLIAHHDDAHERREDLNDHSHTNDADAQKDHDIAVRHAENLHKAVLAAEEQVQRLEYWSDVKGMANGDELLHPERLPKDVTAGGGHPVDAFANKQHHTAGAPQLHGHAEHDSKGRESSAAPSKQSSTWFDAPTSPPDGKAKSSSRLGKSPGDSSDDSNSLDRYTTAAESVAGSDRSGKSSALSPAQRGREKAARLSSLDGMMEEEGEEGGHGAQHEQIGGDGHDDRDKHQADDEAPLSPIVDTTDRNNVESVELEPVPIEGDGVE